jgi:hypothetical protein
MINQLMLRAKNFLSGENTGEGSQKDDYFYNRIFFRKIIAFYDAIFDHINNAAVLNTKETLQPFGLHFDISLKDIIKQSGKPKYLYNNKRDNNHKVAFYRATVNNLSVLMQLHFHNDSLFFIGLDISVGLLTENEKTEIINSIIRKYLSQPYHKGHNYPLIRDAHKNFVMIHDDINFNICYLHGRYVNHYNDLKQAILGDDIASEISKRMNENLYKAF